MSQIDAAYVVISAMARHPPSRDEGESNGQFGKVQIKEWPMERGRGCGISEHITAATWWQGLCASEAISPIASVILQIPPTSAASERNWSLLATLTQKCTTGLQMIEWRKLVVIRSNLKLFEPNADVIYSAWLWLLSVDEMVVGSSTESEGEQNQLTAKTSNYPAYRLKGTQQRIVK